MDYSPPRSSVRRIFQARVPEWVAIPFSRGSSWLREWTQFFLHCRQILYQLSYQGIPYWHGYLGSGSGQGWLEGHGVFLKSSSLHKDSGYQKCFAVVLPGRGFLSSPPFNQRVSHPLTELPLSYVRPGHFTNVDSMSTSKPYEAGTTTTPIVQMRKLKALEGSVTSPRSHSQEVLEPRMKCDYLAPAPVSHCPDFPSSSSKNLSPL